MASTFEAGIECAKLVSQEAVSIQLKYCGFLTCGVSPPRDEPLLFRQKEPKPFLPVRGPSDPAQKQVLQGASASIPNKRAQELALLKQPSPRSRFGIPAPPRPTQVNSRSKKLSPAPNWA
jgi:hypothetical protein